MKLHGVIKTGDKNGASASVTGISLEACLLSLMQSLDLSRPVWLPKHTESLERVGFVRLYPADFIDGATFDALELQLARKKKSKSNVQKDYD